MPKPGTDWEDRALKAEAEVTQLRAAILEPGGWEERCKRAEARVRTLEEALKGLSDAVAGLRRTPLWPILQERHEKARAALREEGKPEGWGYDTETGEEGRP